MYHIAIIKLKNHLANTGIALIQQAASKTNDIAGDGTTTATVLAHAMLKQGMKKKEIVLYIFIYIIRQCDCKIRVKICSNIFELITYYYL